MKLVADKGVSRIGFVIGKAQIDNSDPNNEVEMNAIKDKRLSIVNNSNATLNAISVIGYASPDGTYRKNALLAQERTDVVLDEFVSALPESVREYVKLSSMSVVEPWSSVARLMAEDSLETASAVQAAVEKFGDDYVNTQNAVKRLPDYRNVIAK